MESELRPGVAGSALESRSNRSDLGIFFHPDNCFEVPRQLDRENGEIRALRSTTETIARNAEEKKGTFQNGEMISRRLRIAMHVDDRFFLLKIEIPIA